MAPALLALGTRRDRLSTWEEIGEELKGKWGKGGASPGVYIARPGAMPGKRMAFLVVFPTREQYRGGLTENHLTRETAELEWWQKDHHLLGFGLAKNGAEAVEEALACADRGRVARLDLEIWFDRGPRRFRFFRRSRRDDASYKPLGAELGAEEFRALMVS